MSSATFQLNPEFHPRGDQAQAIAKLVKSVRAGNRHQTLLGVTGSGKTYTMANVIARLGRPAERPDRPGLAGIGERAIHAPHRAGVVAALVAVALIVSAP